MKRITPTLLLSLLMALCMTPTAWAQKEAANDGDDVAKHLQWRGKSKPIRVDDLLVQRRNDLLVVQATVSNTAGGDHTLYWRIRWLDKSGMQVGTGDTWRPLLILGRQTQLLRGTAPMPSASDFVIELHLEGAKP
jgi:uncharacterized protein YcfL